MFSAAAHGFQKVAHVQASADVVFGEQLSARTQCECLPINDFSRQRNIAGNDEVSGISAAHNFIIGDVKSTRHLNGSGVTTSTLITGSNNFKPPFVQASLKQALLANSNANTLESTS